MAGAIRPTRVPDRAPDCHDLVQQVLIVQNEVDRSQDGIDFDQAPLRVGAPESRYDGMDYSVGIARPGPEAAGRSPRNMVIRVEALAGREGGGESVELEEQLIEALPRLADRALAWAGSRGDSSLEPESGAQEDIRCEKGS